MMKGNDYTTIKTKEKHKYNNENGEEKSTRQLTKTREKQPEEELNDSSVRLLKQKLFEILTVQSEKKF